MDSTDSTKFDLKCLKIIVTAIGLTIVVPLIVTNIINN